MGNQPEQKTIKRIQPIDINILLGLYYFRVMSTQQIQERYNLTKSYVYRKIGILRNTGWLMTLPISGYTTKQHRQGAYHRISETGITCLRKQGYPVERKAEELRINKLHLPSLLHIYDLFFSLEKSGWKMTDSRDVKNKYGLDRKDSIQGIFTNPNGEESIVYILRENTLKMTIAKMDGQIKKHSKIDESKRDRGIYERPTANYYIFVKGQQTYLDVLRYLSENTGAVLTAQKMAIMPTTFAKHYLRLFYDEQEVLTYLQTKFSIEDVTTDVYPTLDIKHDGLRTIVKHEGEEKYLVNLMDSDFLKINDILSYKADYYQADGRKLLVISPKPLKNIHQNLLENVHHIDYLTVSFGEIAEYINKTIIERKQQSKKQDVLNS